MCVLACIIVSLSLQTRMTTRDTGMVTMPSAEEVEGRAAATAAKIAVSRNAGKLSVCSKPIQSSVANLS